MILRRSMRYRYLLTGLFSRLLLAGYAQQEEKKEQPATIDSIVVVRDYRPILADAAKIRRSPDMSNKRQYPPKLSYNSLDKELDINTGTKRLTIQENPFSRTQALPNNYAKIGAASMGTR